VKNIILLSLLLAAPCFGASSSENIVVLGRAVSQISIENVDICEPEEVCLGGWYRWTIKIERTLRGKKLGRKISAVRIDTSQYLPSTFKKPRIFILVPIDAPDKRALLKAEYYLQYFSTPREMQCFDDSIDVGVDIDDRLKENGGYCVEISKIQGGK
jgi:hypothetical protein